jgi:hsp70-interacting protein
MQEYMKDFVERMKEIKEAVESPDDQSSLEEKEELLEELIEIVESVDYARDLHKIGGLPTLLALLQSPHPGLRWRAAEVVAACTQNHPQVSCTTACRWLLQDL